MVANLWRIEGYLTGIVRSVGEEKQVRHNAHGIRAASHSLLGEAA